MIDYDKDMNQLWKEIDQEKLEKKEIIENICAQRIAVAGVIGSLTMTVRILNAEKVKSSASGYTLETIASWLQDNIQDLENIIGYHHPKEEASE